MGQKKLKQGWIRPAAEILPQLERQIGFIRSSCGAFDRGDIYEACRLATSVFVVVDDGGHRSLLTQLGRRDVMFIDSTQPALPHSASPYMPMVGMKIGSASHASQYIPSVSPDAYAQGPARLSDWWERRIIFDDKAGGQLSRRQLAFTLRSQEGGSHFDSQISNLAYVGLSRDPGPGWFTGSGAGPAAAMPPTAHFSMMRVIAFEVERSLVEAGLVQGPISTMPVLRD